MVPHCCVSFPFDLFFPAPLPHTLTACRFVAVQFDIIWEDKLANHAIIEQMLDDHGVAAGAFVLLPELGDTGFSFNLDAIVDDRTITWASALARSRGIWLQAGFAQHGPEGKGRNVAAIINPGGQVAVQYEKIHPFSFGREAEHYNGGDHLAVCDTGALQVAPLICYDLRFPELWRLAATAGAAVFTIGASWPDARQSHWTQLAIARAIENQAFVVACNRVGRDPSLGYAGGSIIVNPMGEVLAQAGTEPAVISATLNAEEVAAWRRTFPALRDIRSQLAGQDQHPPEYRGPGRFHAQRPIARRFR